MLVRQGAIYHFRRRVPPALQPILKKREIWYSLRTSNRRVAMADAAFLWAGTECVFMGNEATAVERLGALLATLDVKRQRGERLTESDNSDIRHLSELAKLETALKVQKAELLKAKLEEIRLVTSALEHEKMMRGAFAEAAAASLDFGTRYLESKSAQNIMENMVSKITASASANGQTPATKESPLFSENIEAFLLSKTMPKVHLRADTDKGEKWINSTVLQARSSFMLWIELIGDKPVSEYKSRDAENFKRSLLQLPSSFRKGAREPAAEAIKRVTNARECGVKVDTITMKTAKKHNSFLSAYWKWLKLDEFVVDNIFLGIEFPGTMRGKKSKVDQWSDDDLNTLFHSQRYLSADRTSADFWLPLIALHSGMRLEEIARLRSNEDIIFVDDILCFDLKPHPDGWDPKTEAGIRSVPVHTALLNLGFVAFVAGHRQGAGTYLFPDLYPSGPDARRGAAFSRSFSRFKISLGIGEKTKFHSFRHNARTLVKNANPQPPKDWTDDVFGHASDDSFDDGDWTASEGDLTYAKSAKMANAQIVIEAIKPNVYLGHLFPGI